jgi:hypothetical protein
VSWSDRSMCGDAVIYSSIYLPLPSIGETEHVNEGVPSYSTFLDGRCLHVQRRIGGLLDMCSIASAHASMRGRPSSLDLMKDRILYCFRSCGSQGSICQI